MFETGKRGRSSRLQVLVLLTVGWLCLWLPRMARAEGELKPIKLRIGGQAVRLSVPPVADDTEAYAPLDVLRELDMMGEASKRGDSVKIMVLPRRETVEVAIARPNGTPMLALSELARAVDGRVERPEQKGPDGKPLTGKPGDTVYLLARIQEAKWEQDALRIKTSFPVPFQVRHLGQTVPPRSYVDCVGAFVSEEFECEPVPEGATALKVRAGRNTTEVARVVVEMAPGGALKPFNAPLNSGAEIVVALAKPGDNLAAPQNSVIAEDTSRPASPKPATPKPTRTSPSRPAAPIVVQNMTFEPVSNQIVRIRLNTTGPSVPYVRYQDTDNSLLMDLANATLQLPEDQETERILKHPLVKALKIEQATDNSSVTRLTVALSRIAGFSVNTTGNAVVLELRLPRNASGALADKTVVLDPGHGGTSSGATAGGVYEKDVTLGISLRLRKALEAAGARVVMTRDRDATVPLYDRPRLANDVQADFFISIHSDSNARPNSVSGSSTWYHKRNGDTRALAACIQREICAVSGLPNRGVKSDLLMYQNGFAVLREIGMPGVLVEVAFINHARDRAKLVNSTFQERIAQAIYRGLRTYVEGSPGAPPPLAEPASHEEAMPFPDEADGFVDF